MHLGLFFFLDPQYKTKNMYQNKLKTKLAWLSHINWFNNTWLKQLFYIFHRLINIKIFIVYKIYCNINTLTNAALSAQSIWKKINKSPKKFHIYAKLLFKFYMFYFDLVNQIFFLVRMSHHSSLVGFSFSSI